MSTRLRLDLKWRLSVLWVLEWGVTGTILTYLPLYLSQIGLKASQTAQLLAVSAIGLWIAPFVVGQVADRWMSSEKYLALSHFVGGLTLFFLPFAAELYRDDAENFSIMLAMVGLYAVAYFPTVPVASALTFQHLPDPQAQFGKVRVWGTVGWMLSGLGLSLWLGRQQAYDWLTEHVPEWRPVLTEWGVVLNWLPAPTSSDCFRIAALLSFALSSFCVFLPRTPPARPLRRGLAPLQTLGMFRDRTFSLLVGISLLLALVVPLYTLEVPKLLEQLGFDSNWVPAVMLIGQISEFPALLLLPLFLKRIGLKITFAVGMGAWFVRYVLFALQQPQWLILTGLALHGVCHVFLIIVIQLYVHAECRPDLRVSAQNLFTFITMGVGMPLGALLWGQLGDVCYDHATGRTDFRVLFSVPAAIILVLLIAYGKWCRISVAADGSRY